MSADDAMIQRVAAHLFAVLDFWGPIHRSHYRYRSEGCPWCVIYGLPHPPDEVDDQLRLAGSLT